jgi:hypothetical protein
MASIQKRIRNGKTTYRVQYRDPSGAMRGRSFTRMADARRFQTETEHAKEHGAWTDPRAGKATLRSYGDAHLAAQTFDETPARRSRCGYACTSTRTSATTRLGRCARASSRHGPAVCNSSSRRATSAWCSPT